MIPLIEREVVYKNKWIDDEDFLDMISIAQSAPGLIAVNVAIFIGHRIAGIKGSIVATIGSVVPPFIIILLVAAVFTTFKDNAAVQAVFKGIRPAVVALIAAPVIRMDKEPAQLDNRRDSRCRHSSHRIPKDIPHLDHNNSHLRRPGDGLQPAGQAQS